MEYIFKAALIYGVICGFVCCAICAFGLLTRRDMVKHQRSCALWMMQRRMERFGCDDTHGLLIEVFGFQDWADFFSWYMHEKFSVELINGPHYRSMLKVLALRLGR